MTAMLSRASCGHFVNAATAATCATCRQELDQLKGSIEHQGSRRVELGGDSGDPIATAPFTLTEFCPGPKCRRRRHNGYLSCGRHWAQVPETQRRAVYTAFTAYKDTPTADTLERLRAAQAAAVSCMREVNE